MEFSTWFRDYLNCEPKIDPVDEFRRAFVRLQHTIDNNTGFPECVEASNDFTLKAYEAAKVMFEVKN